MECYKIYLYKRRTIIYYLLSNPVSIGLRGCFCVFEYLKRSEKAVNLKGRFLDTYLSTIFQ